MPIRVLMLSQYPFAESDHALGGIMQTTYQLVAGFIALNDPGIEIHLLSLNESCTQAQVRTYGSVKVLHIPKSKSRFGFILSEPFRLFWHFTRLLITFRPQVLHAQGNVSFIMLSLLYGRSSVQTVHGIFRNEQKTIPRNQQTASMKLRFALRQMLETFYLGAITTLIVTSTQLADLAKKVGGRKKTIVWIDNSVDEGFFLDDSVRAERHLRPATRLLFVGLITPRKGLHFLLPAFRRIAAAISGVTLHIVGMDAAPDYVAGLKREYADLIEGRHLVFTGAISQKHLIEEYRRADIFVLPSLGETAPVAISQAMCAGLPIVATHVGGIPDMITTGETGIIVPPSDAMALEDALLRQLSDSGNTRAMGEKGQKKGGARYHPASNAAKMLKLYQGLATPKG